MSRTYRKGKPKTSLRYYYNIGAFYKETKVSAYNGEPWWKYKFDGTYEEYVVVEKAKWHADSVPRGQGGIPWYFRNVESRKLANKHRLEITRWVRSSQETELVLTPFKRDLGWWYY